MQRNYVLGLSVILVMVGSIGVFAQGGVTAAGGKTTRVVSAKVRAVPGVFALTALPQANLLTGPNSQLNLTNEQKTALKSLLTEYKKAQSKPAEGVKVAGEKKKRVSLQADLDNAGRELRNALMTKGVDAEVIAAKVKAAREAEDVIIAVNSTYWAKLTQILTEEQLKQLYTSMTTRPAKTADTKGTGTPDLNKQNNTNSQDIQQ